MALLNKSDRQAIVKGLMAKTHHRARIEAARRALGAALAAATYAKNAAAHGEEVQRCIDTMPAAVRRVLLNELENTTINLHGSARNLFLNTWMAMGHQSFVDDVLGAYRGSSFRVRFPSPVFLPYMSCDEAGPSDVADASVIKAFDNAVAEAVATENSLIGFLSTVRTVEQLKKAMPEACAFVAEKDHPVAIAIDPSNALAALSRAGAFDNAEALA